MAQNIIFYLVKRGAHREPVRATTGDIALATGMSQQTASRRLISLEKEGKVIRQGGAISLTPKAVAEVHDFVRSILSALEGGQITFSGKVVSGLGQGAYYLSQKSYQEQIKKKLGFAPFKGTLNVDVGDEGIEKRMALHDLPAVKISGFTSGKKTFGSIDAYQCVINGMSGAIVFPSRSQHGLRVLEIIAPFSLRKKLGLADGSAVNIETV